MKDMKDRDSFPKWIVVAWIAVLIFACFVFLCDPAAGGDYGSYSNICDMDDVDCSNTGDYYHLEYDDTSETWISREVINAPSYVLGPNPVGSCDDAISQTLQIKAVPLTINGLDHYFADSAVDGCDGCDRGAIVLAASTTSCPDIGGGTYFCAFGWNCCDNQGTVGSWPTSLPSENGMKGKNLSAVGGLMGPGAYVLVYTFSDSADVDTLHDVIGGAELTYKVTDILLWDEETCGWAFNPSAVATTCSANCTGTGNPPPEFNGATVTWSVWSGDCGVACGSNTFDGSNPDVTAESFTPSYSADWRITPDGDADLADIDADSVTTTGAIEAGTSLTSGTTIEAGTTVSIGAGNYILPSTAFSNPGEVLQSPGAGATLEWSDNWDGTASSNLDMEQYEINDVSRAQFGNSANDVSSSTVVGIWEQEFINPGSGFYQPVAFNAFYSLTPSAGGEANDTQPLGAMMNVAIDMSNAVSEPICVGGSNDGNPCPGGDPDCPGGECNEENPDITWEQGGTAGTFACEATIPTGLYYEYASMTAGNFTARGSNDSGKRGKIGRLQGAYYGIDANYSDAHILSAMDMNINALSGNEIDDIFHIVFSTNMESGTNVNNDFSMIKMYIPYLDATSTITGNLTFIDIGESLYSPGYDAGNASGQVGIDMRAFNEASNFNVGINIREGWNAGDYAIVQGGDTSYTRDSDTEHGQVHFLRSRNGSLDPDSGDDLGEIAAYGYDSAGGAYNPSASILFEAADDHALNDSPGKVSIWATPDGSDTLSKVVEFDSDGTHLEEDLYSDRWRYHDSNVFIGVGVLGAGNLSGAGSPLARFNTNVGYESGYEYTSAYANAGLGTYTFRECTTCNANQAFGYGALQDLETGTGNSATGQGALRHLQTGNENTSVGNGTLWELTEGNEFTAIGESSLREMLTGDRVTAIGWESGYWITEDVTEFTDGTNSVYVGALARASGDGVTNENVFGYNAQGKGSNTVKIGNSDIAETWIEGELYANADGEGDAHFFSASTDPGAGSNSHLYVYGWDDALGNVRYGALTIDEDNGTFQIYPQAGERLELESDTEVEINDGADSDVTFFEDATSGENPFVYVYGYDTGATAAKWGRVYVDSTGTFYLSAQTGEAAVLQVSGSGMNEIEVGPAKIGVFGTTPASQTAAFTQTYSSASRTNPAMTSADLAITASSGGWGYSSEAEANSVETELNALRDDVESTKDLLNQVVDDLQTYGWFQ